uniref:G-protein coupled receptors family 1 profile domain-containing protein n=1 Tax=Caenorhabditis japonica TaxID=281687 RepID=A0A8R1E1F3_CAEJA
MHLIAFANWTSAVAIWLVVGVCFERVAGVRSPLHRLNTPSRGKLITGLVTLLSSGAALTFYNHVSHHCFIKSFCNATQIMAVCLDVNLDVWPNNRTNISPPALRTYVAATRAANAVLVVFLPMILLVVLNLMLLYYVKKRSFFVYATLGKVSARVRKAGEVALPFVNTLFRRHSDQVCGADS